MSEELDYRPISSFAVVTFWMSLASVAGFIDPLLGVTGISAVCLAIYSLWRIARYEQQGKVYAVAGLVIAGGCCIAGSNLALRPVLRRSSRWLRTN